MRCAVARSTPEKPPLIPHDPFSTPFESECVRRKRHNDRRRSDRLSQAQPNTWRMLVIKVASRVVVSCRRVCIELSSTWPHLSNLLSATLAVAGSSK
jgi:hypothetical protein